MTNRRRAAIASTICRISGSVAAIVSVDLVEDLVDPVLAGDRVVVLKPELRDALQAQAPADLPPQKRRRPFERAAAVLPGLLVAEHGVEDARLLEVGAALHARERDEPDAGVVYISGKKTRQLIADLIRHAIGS